MENEQKIQQNCFKKIPPFEVEASQTGAVLLYKLKDAKFLSNLNSIGMFVEGLIWENPL